jgi:thiol:disulfide interchange protein
LIYDRAVRALIATAFLVTACAHTGPRMLPYELEAANAAHEPLVIELGATWCGPCHIFAEKVLPDPRVQAALAGIHFVRYDVDTTAGADAQARVGSRGIPTVVGIDHDGHIRVYKQGTEDTADSFLEFLREVHVVLGATGTSGPP